MSHSPQASRHIGFRLALVILLAIILMSVVSTAVIFSGALRNPFRGVVVATSSPTAIAVATALPTATPISLKGVAPQINAAAAIIIDPTTGQQLYGVGATDSHAMASTTKIMTAITTLFSSVGMNQSVTVGSEVNQLNQYDTKMGCLPGQTYTVRDLLYGLLLPSGDDAALVLADAVAGSQAAFVARMNIFARFLGMTSTHFINTHGLDDGTLTGANVTSARDLATLATFAMQNATFRQIVGTPTYTIPANTTHDAVVLASTNEFLDSHKSKSGYGFTAKGASLGIDGIKTGYTGLAGYCLVSEARFNGHAVIIVLLDEPGDQTDAAFEQRFVDATALFQWLEPQMTH